MTTPTRRIRNARLRYARSHAAARAHRLAARLRHKDIALCAVARAGDAAMLAADALRMERDAAHEECAALRDLLAVARSTLVAAQTLILEDAERIATLTAERDHARAIAVALEQGAVGIDPIPPYVREVPCWTVICDECHRDASEATDYSGYGDRWQDATDFLLTDVGGAEACGVAICQTCASQKVHCQSCGREHWGFWGNCIDCWNQATPAPQPTRVPMDSDRTPEVEG